MGMQILNNFQSLPRNAFIKLVIIFPLLLFLGYYRAWAWRWVLLLGNWQIFQYFKHFRYADICCQIVKCMNFSCKVGSFFQRSKNHFVFQSRFVTFCKECAISNSYGLNKAPTLLDLFYEMRKHFHSDFLGIFLRKLA